MKLEQIVLKDGSPDQLKSILAVLNRTGFDEKTTIQHVHSGSVELNHTDAALESLAFAAKSNWRSADVPSNASMPLRPSDWRTLLGPTFTSAANAWTFSL